MRGVVPLFLLSLLLVRLPHGGEAAPACASSPYTILSSSMLDAMLTLWTRTSPCDGTLLFSSSQTYRLASSYNISTEIILDGASVSSKVTLLPAGGYNRHFNVTAGGKLVALNMIFSDGLYQSAVSYTTTLGQGGGSIRFGDLTSGYFQNCLFQNNSAINSFATGGSAYGGALLAWGRVDLKLVDTDFKKNTVRGTFNSMGGAVAFGGSASASYNMDVTRGNFSLNTAICTSPYCYQGTGGGVWHSVGGLILSGVTFLANSAIVRSTCANSPEYQGRARGGAVTTESSASLSVTTCTFTRNIANITSLMTVAATCQWMALGGAMSISTTPTVTFTSSDFLGNKAVAQTNSVHVSGANRGNGGACYISATATSLSITSCSFTSNAAMTKGYPTGGSLSEWYARGGALMMVSLTTPANIAYTTFTSNQAWGVGTYIANGGAVAQVSSAHGVFFTSCTFKENTAYASNPYANASLTSVVASGGAVYSEDSRGSLNFTSCTLTDNSAKGRHISLWIDHGQHLLRLNLSQDLHAPLDPFILISSDNGRNLCLRRGGFISYAVSRVDYSTLDSNSAIIMGGSSLYGNECKGGGAYFHRAFTVLNSNFIRNKVQSPFTAIAGAIYGYGHTVYSINIKSTTFTSNIVNATGAVAYYSSGGAMRLDNYLSSNLRYCTFLSSRAIVRGSSFGYSAIEGTAVLLGYISTESTLERLNFTNNLGEIYTTDPSDTTTILTARGALYSTRAAFVMTDSQFIGNRLVLNGGLSSSSYALGAGLAVDTFTTTIRITSVVFVSNTITSTGTGWQLGTQFTHQSSTASLLLEWSYLSGSLLNGAAPTWDGYSDVSSGLFSCLYTTGVVGNSGTSVCSAKPTTISPTQFPSTVPSTRPTLTPTQLPTVLPSRMPTTLPTVRPTQTPSALPTVGPTQVPTVLPSVMPTTLPTVVPTDMPTIVPTVGPTDMPTVMPTQTPSTLPSGGPTVVPTESPSGGPTVTPTSMPTTAPTNLPTVFPSVHPTMAPTAAPSAQPTTAPTMTPTGSPTAPTISPTSRPSTLPTQAPTPVPLAPKFSLMTVSNQSSTSLAVAVTLTKPGLVYCAVFTPPRAGARTAAEIRASAYPVNITTAYTASPTRVWLTGLIPLTKYQVNCFTEDYVTPPNVLPQYLIAGTSKNATTTCCHTVTLPTLPTGLYAGDTSSTLRLTSTLTTASPAVRLLVSTYYYASLTSSSACTTSNIMQQAMAFNSSRNLTVSPKVMTLASGSASFTIRARHSGCYAMNLTLAGALNTSFARPEMQVIYVLARNAPKPAPLLSSAQFTSTGNAITVAFDADTDQGGLSGSFSCSLALSFPSSSSASCSWSTPSTLRASLGSSATVLPGDSVTLASTLVLRAACTVTNCTSWPTTSVSQSTPVLRPSSPLVPEPVLSYSPRVSTCADLIVDASGSTGSGGRSMQYTWSVSSPDLSSMALTNMSTYLITTANAGTGAKTLTVPSTYLAIGTLSLTLSLKNFLDGTSAAAAAAVRVSGGTSLPSVTVRPAATTIFRSQALSLYADASLPSCASPKTIRYKWSSASGSLASSSSDPRVFRLAANTLLPGSTYTIKANATGPGNLTNTATATVTVVVSPLKAIISGGTARVIGTDQSLTLDGSSSYDPDTSVAALNYTWACIRGGNAYGDSCELGSGTSTTTSRLAAGQLAAGVYIFTLAIRGTFSRIASTSVTITVLAGSLPIVSLRGSSGNMSRIDPTSRFNVIASIKPSNSTVAASNVTATWSLPSGSLADGMSLRAAAAAPVVISFMRRGGLAVAVPAALTIRAGTLVAGTSYTLRLSVGQGGQASFSELKFVTAAPPTSGQLLVSPSSGRALQTPFSFTMRGWVDDAEDLPLTYTYAFILGGDGGTEVALLTKSFLTAVTGITMPQGEGTLSNLTGVGYATDLYGAAARTTFAPLNVLPARFTVTELAGNVTSLLANAVKFSDIDSIFQVTVAAASALGQSDCNSTATQASGCANLRSSLLSFLTIAASKQDTTSANIDQQSAVLQSLSSGGGDANLDEAGQALALDLLVSVSGGGAAVGLLPSTIGAMGSTIDSLLAATADNITAAFSTKMSIIFDNLVEGAWSGLTMSEEPRSVATATFAMTAALAFASSLGNATIQPPVPNTSISLPPMGAAGFLELGGEDSVGVAVSSFPPLVASQSQGGGDEMISQRMRLHISSRESSSSASLSQSSSRRRQLLLSTLADLIMVRIPIALKGPLQTNVIQTSLNCSAGEQTVKTFTCPGGTVKRLTCSGTVSSLPITCVTGNASECGVWDASSNRFETSTCRTEPSEDVSSVLTCTCSGLRGYNAEPSVGSFSADLGAVVVTVFKDFVSIMRTAEGLTLQDVVTNIVVFVTIGIILQGSVLLCLAGYRRDLADKRREGRMAPALSSRKVKPNAVAMHPEDEAAALAAATSQATGVDLTMQEKQVIKSSLPGFAVVGDYWQLLVREMGRRHDWFSVVMVYSQRYSRPYRIALITTATLALMFFNALLYQLSDQTSSCSAITQKQECLTATASFSSDPICEWDLASGACAAGSGKASLTVQLAIAIVSNMLAAPITLLIRLIFEKMLLPPTRINNVKFLHTIVQQGKLGAAYVKAHMGDPARASMHLMSQIRAQLGRKTHAQQQQDKAAQQYQEQYQQYQQQYYPQQMMMVDANGKPLPPSLQPAPRPPRGFKGLLAGMAERRRRAAALEIERAQRKAKYDAFLDQETAKMIGRAQEQRKELVEAIQAEQAKHDFLKAESDNAAKTVVAASERRLKVLKDFLHKYEAKWGLTSDGTVQSPTRWDRLRRTSPITRQRSKVAKDIAMARRIEWSLSRLPPAQREIRLMEMQRLDALSAAERKIYLRNMIEFKAEQAMPLPPVDRRVKIAGWLLIVVLNLFFGFVVVLFGVYKGPATTNAWLLSFLTSVIQDPLLNSPLLIIFFNVILPMYIRVKIKVNIDGAGTDPYIFKTFMPTGPACRVALNHPQWVSARLIDKTTHPYQQLARKKGPASPTTNMQSQGGGSMSPFSAGNTDPAFHTDLQKRSEAHFLERYSKAPQLPFLLLLLFPLVFFLMLLPTRLADVIVQDLISAATGAVIIGYAYIEGVKPGLGIIIMAALVGLVAIVIAYQIFRRKTTRRTTAPADRYILTDQHTKAVLITSKASTRDSVIPARKDVQPQPPPSDVADKQSVLATADSGASLALGLQPHSASQGRPPLGGDENGPDAIAVAHAVASLRLEASTRKAGRRLGSTSGVASTRHDTLDDTLDPSVLALSGGSLSPQWGNKTGSKSHGEAMHESLHPDDRTPDTGGDGVERQQADLSATSIHAEASAAQLMTARTASSTGIGGRMSASRSSLPGAEGDSTSGGASNDAVISSPRALAEIIDINAAPTARTTRSSLTPWASLQTKDSTGTESVASSATNATATVADLVIEDFDTTGPASSTIRPPPSASPSAGKAKTQSPVHSADSHNESKLAGGTGEKRPTTATASPTFKMSSLLVDL